MVVPRGMRNSLTDCVLQSLTLDWEKFVRVMRFSIVRPPKKGLSLKSYVFGKERVVLRLQKHRRLYVNLLLRNTLFGINLCKMRGEEIVYQTKRTSVLHIASQSRMKEIFTLNGLSSVGFSSGERTLSCCGKVNVVVQGRNMIGYIMSESPRHWKVQLGNKEARYIQKPVYVKEFHQYHFSQREPRITEYWPIRLKISNSGDTTYTINRISFDSTSHIVMFQHST